MVFFMRLHYILLSLCCIFFLYNFTFHGCSVAAFPCLLGKLDLHSWREAIVLYLWPSTAFTLSLEIRMREEKGHPAMSSL